MSNMKSLSSYSTERSFGAQIWFLSQSIYFITPSATPYCGPTLNSSMTTDDGRPVSFSSVH